MAEPRFGRCSNRVGEIVETALFARIFSHASLQRICVRKSSLPGFSAISTPLCRRIFKKPNSMRIDQDAADRAAPATNRRARDCPKRVRLDGAPKTKDRTREARLRA
jgi:hypothetical protein